MKYELGNGHVASFGRLSLRVCCVYEPPYYIYFQRLSRPKISKSIVGAVAIDVVYVVWQLTSRHVIDDSMHMHQNSVAFIS